MATDYEIFKCQTLIKMLIRRKKNPERAMEIYSKSTYEKASNKIKQSNQKKIDDY